MPNNRKTSLVVTCEREQKIRYLWQAKREGMKLEDWLLKHLDDVCDAAGTPHPENDKKE